MGRSSSSSLTVGSGPTWEMMYSSPAVQVMPVALTVLAVTVAWLVGVSMVAMVPW